MGDRVKPMDIPKILEAVGCQVEVADPFDVEEALDRAEEDTL